MSMLSELEQFADMLKRKGLLDLVHGPKSRRIDRRPFLVYSIDRLEIIFRSDGRFVIARRYNELLKEYMPAGNSLALAMDAVKVACARHGVYLRQDRIDHSRAG